jgi:3',5'-cyclic AMP phosphodiesterase CpdA
MTCLVLDTNWKNRVVSLTDKERARQAAWLRKQLKKPRTAPWLIVLGHHPLYSNGVHGDQEHLIEEWGPLFQKRRVDFYFAGHDHDLQHLEFSGKRTSFVVSGGGGARVRDLKKEDRGPFAKAVYGFTHLQVNPEKFIVRHLDANQKILHTFHRTPDGKVHIGA